MHLMADIETYGTSSNAPVFEIGVVEFDATAIRRKFHSLVRLDFDRTTPDLATIVWWLSQPIKPLITESAPLFPSVVSDLAGWLGNEPYEGVWANSPSFDLVILHNLAKSYGINMPWNRKQYRDMRTFKMFGERLDVLRVESETKHRALIDAIAQAQWVININRALVLKGVGVL